MTNVLTPEERLAEVAHAEVLSKTATDMTDADFLSAALCVSDHASDVEDAKFLLTMLGLFTSRADRLAS